MVILKKIIIMTEYQKSGCSGIVKFENFAGRTSCFVRILGINQGGQICIKCGDDIMYCGELKNGEMRFGAMYDLNKVIRIIVMQEGGVVCLGSNYGKFMPSLLVNYIHQYIAQQMKIAGNKLQIQENDKQAVLDNTSVNNQQNYSDNNQREQSEIIEKDDSQISDIEQASQMNMSDNNTVSDMERHQNNTSNISESTNIIENVEVQNIQDVDNKMQSISNDENIILSNSEYVADKDAIMTDTNVEEGFYKKIENSMQELFDRYEGDSELNLLVPDSKWVRVPVENNGYYVVGVIYSDNLPYLICYGVPDKDNTNPPQNSGECRQWLELEKGGRGYWMMYQSAKSGQTLTTQII